VAENFAKLPINVAEGVSRVLKQTQAEADPDRVNGGARLALGPSGPPKGGAAAPESESALKSLSPQRDKLAAAILVRSPCPVPTLSLPGPCPDAPRGASARESGAEACPMLSAYTRFSSPVLLLSRRDGRD
jgi:hypothetical protein